MKKLESKREEIVKKYKAGTTQRELALKYGVSKMTISNRILEYYGIFRYIPKRDHKLPMKKIVEDYEAGTTQQELADRYGYARQTISKKILAYYEENGKPEAEKSRNSKDLPVDEITEKYKQGISQYKLASEYSVHRRTIARKLEESGALQPTKVVPCVNIPLADIAQMYEDGTSISIIAKDFDTSEITISKKINKYYLEKGIAKPKILKSVTTLIDYLNKGLTIEEIIEIARKKNIIIPQSIIDTAFDNVKHKDLTSDDDAR